MISEQKIKEWVAMYLQHITEITTEVHVTEEEGYKFKAVDVFQRNFDIGAKDPVSMLDAAIVNNNMVVGHFFFPRKMLLIFAEESPDAVRSILQVLFDEKKKVGKRIDEAITAFNKLMAARNEKLHEEGNDFIDIRFLSLLLSYRYPEKHNVIKSSEWKKFCKFIDDEFPVLYKGKSNGEKYELYEKYIDALIQQIKDNSKIHEIHSQLVRGLKFKDSQFRWMAQDVIYVTAKISSKNIKKGSIENDEEEQTSGGVGKIKKEEKKSKNDKEEFENTTDFKALDTLVLPAPLSNMKITPSPLTFDSLLKDVYHGLVQIPPFQRNFVWKPKEIAFLLDSIYRGYPIGSFIFWKTIKRLDHHRAIGGLALMEPPIGAQINYVLDGQQRITSLYAAVKGVAIEGEKYNFFFNVIRGIFELERANIAREVVQPERIPLEKLFVDATQYYRYVSGFPEQYQEKMNELFDRFNRYAFSVIYVQNEDELRRPADDKQDDIKKIVHIFSRINETGKKLTVVAKMIARSWGENFDLRGKLDELLGTSDKLSEIHEEIVLQAASVILNNKKSQTKNILQDTDIRKLEAKWNDISAAFRLSLDFIKDKIQVKNFKYLPFDATLVPLTYFHYHQHGPNNNQVEQLCRWFWKACLSNRYGSTVEGKYEEDCKFFDRILQDETVEFNYPIDWETFKVRLIDQKYSLKNAFNKTILTLYSIKKPKNFSDNRDIDLVDTFSNYNKSQMHHFFPKGFLDRINHPKTYLKDSIVNIAFAPALWNSDITDKAPSDYIGEFSRANPDIKEMLGSHLIGDMQEFGITIDDFDKFLEKRAEMIENEFRSLLGLRSKTEKQFEDEPSTPIDALEVVMRDLLDGGLRNEFGENYWSEGIPEDVRMLADEKIMRDIRSHPYNEEKYLEGRERLNFLDLSDYSRIIMKNWSVFKDLFISRGELERHFLALMKYRNSLKHNRQPEVVDRKNGEAAILWFQKIFDSTELNN